MGDTNYFSGIVKILETPYQSFKNDQKVMITFRAEVSQNRNNKIIYLVFWGNLGHEVKNFYKINDYILIEGYISVQITQRMSMLTRNPKRITITVLKVYPFLLDSNRNFSKI
jgi:hypothetical protein